MTAITVKYHGSIPSDNKDFLVLMRRLSVVPMIVFGSKDVQVESLRMDGPIQQFVVGEDGSPDRTEDSSIVLNILHVHQEATQEDNNLVAKAALAAIWETLPREWISNPNVLVLQNGSTSYGWAEGHFNVGSFDILDAFWHRALGQEMAKIKLGAKLGVFLRY